MAFEENTLEELQAEIDRRTALASGKPAILIEPDFTDIETMLNTIVDDIAKGQKKKGITVSMQMFYKTVIECFFGPDNWNWFKDNI
jgi:hypothetical protein